VIEQGNNTKKENEAMKKMILIMSMALLVASAFGAQNKVSDGSVVYYEASSDIEAGEIVDLGGRYGIALVDIDNGDSGSVAVDGVWELEKAVINSIDQDTPLYCSSDTQVTDTATADTYIGVCFEDSDGGNVGDYIKVAINILPRESIVGVDIQAQDDEVQELADEDRYAILGPDNTDSYVVVGWTGTLSSGTHTYTFDSAFSEDPIAVVVQYAEDPGSETNRIYAAQADWTTTECEVTGDADVLYTGIAIGKK
jgi:predicted RecA/RadA family phage recombinase